METDGRHAKPVGTETGAEDNVVRLPRDWLGPREELIPFGPAAEGDDDGLATPPSTHDFWGEPAPGLWTPDSKRAGRASRRALLRLRGSELFARSLADVGEHRLAAAMASLIAVGVLALVFGQAGGGSRHHQLSAAASRSAPTQTALAGLSSGRALPSLASKGRRTTGHRSSRGAHRRAKAPVKHHVVHRGSRPVTKVATVQSVHYVSPAAASRAASPSSGSVSPTPHPPTSSPAQASAAPPSGSTHQPALGAAGALAPGRSPDS